MIDHLRTDAIAFLTLSLLTANVASAVADDSKDVQAAVTKFHDALNTLFTGDVGPMKDCWSHADDTTYMGPSGGFQVGWKQIEPYWDMQASKKLGGKVVPTDIRLNVGASLAVAQYYEKGENVVNGKPQPVSIRATTTFRKENGQWKVIGHHTDTLPYLQKPNAGDKSQTSASSGSSSGRQGLRRRRLL